MKKLIVFNWKMNPDSYHEAEKLAQSVLDAAKESKKADIVICPPFIYLLGLAGLLKKTSIKLGAQNVFWEDKGAFTGEISPMMLRDLGVQYVIVGHSERRRYLDETDEMINKKVKAGLSAGLKVILCVGEDLKIRRRGKKAVMNFVKKQLEKDLKGTKNYKLKIKNLIVAYEPIWAIGTGVPCAPEDAAEMIKFIKNILITHYSLLNPMVLYGGSVTGENIEYYIKYKEIDGALVGGASLKPEQFINII
jgi:triosephosphate isomerase